MYALSLETLAVENLACRDGGYNPWRDQVYGYGIRNAARHAQAAAELYRGRTSPLGSTSRPRLHGPLQAF